MNISTGRIMITISSILTTCGLAKLRLLDNLYLPLCSPLGDLKIFSGTKGQGHHVIWKKGQFWIILREQILSGNYQQTPDVREQNCKILVTL